MICPIWAWEANEGTSIRVQSADRGAYWIFGGDLSDRRDCGALCGQKQWRQGSRPAWCRTGNPGALNAAKILGWKWGAIVLAGDVVKGALASLAGRALAGDNGAYAAGSGAVIGHCAPVWSGFRGGKGLATSAGTSLVCFPAYMPIDVSLAAATLALSRGRAGTATYVASAVFIAAALYWWRSGKGNVWGPKPTAGLPLYAISLSAIIAYRFLTAPPSPTADTNDILDKAVDRRPDILVAQAST